MSGQRPVLGMLFGASLAALGVRASVAHAQEVVAASAQPATAPTVAPLAPSTPAVTSAAPSAPAATPAAPSAPAVTSAAPAAPAAAAVPTAPAARLATSPGEAVVHVAVNHRDAWLETRSYVDGGEFVRTCAAPCDVKLLVEGREARVTAPGMTTSNIFRFDAGSGTAGVRVEGGSASARSAGIISLAVGIPIALAGMGLYAQGRVKESSGLQAAGIAGLAAGGLSVAISLPLLIFGSTHVRDAKGSFIAWSEPSTAGAL